ncbi:MAG TPA: NAD(P)H-hydrate dehydratase [Chitinophagaceae bacterium]|nr:NAD(P)H-hydrate dehydratase [Chitinophagaceae bacterium]
MKILTAEQIRAWDQFTIEHEPIHSIDLMERAASKCCEWLEENNWFIYPFAIFCGKGNNGGDGLALARMLANRGCTVSVFILEFGHRGTEDFQTNLARLHQYPGVTIQFIQDESPKGVHGTNFHELSKEILVIDALFGSGLSRPLDGITSKLVEHINSSKCTVVAIDIPSGMAVDCSSKGNTIIKAAYTLSFQCYKQALLIAENAEFIGEVVILDIGLSAEYINQVETKLELIDDSIINSIYRPRKRFAHKGNFGHALIIAGSYGKIGAVILSSKACLRTGTGLLTCFIPKCGYEIIQTAVPEAMVMTDTNSSIITKIDEDFSKYDSIGIGPGLGTASETRAALKELLSAYKKPIVVDADGLNSLSMEKKLPALPPGSILTPHPKEFERLFGECENDFERIDKAVANAKSFNCSIVLKGHHTFIATAGGKGYFNSTGNAGMATAGSGDVLTGMITALLVQGYSSEQAAILGVYLHGHAGDIAAKQFSQEAMIAGDIVDSIGNAFKQLPQ